MKYMGNCPAIQMYNLPFYYLYSIQLIKPFVIDKIYIENNLENVQKFDVFKHHKDNKIINNETLLLNGYSG
jgi:hypothetical protein